MAGATFPIDGHNRKEIREQLLLDSRGQGIEDALADAATRAAGPGHEVFVTRGYGPAGRLAVLIVDRRESSPSTGTKREREKALREALARVKL
ncbi:hypothetical protein [Homoserinibacter sp. GY 40078]|uniref:hypothetical protein n=1 Tax=Homoserinibacter sp. GY 40078 TaxID=2603275 RepID=UPI0011CA4803|nr:hypothetical protein [Homoserinibacter sp. GY 40078]TXK17404.1 hypothetical protein FVQ89_11255 [Homoserinibacter sp. GY 40078]